MKQLTMDGNAAAAHVSYAFSEHIVIYPITPSSPMAELADEWSATSKTNLFGQIPDVIEMQSEAGAAGAVHGTLTAGGLATTYTSSQGLLLMIPNMYKIAGELLPTVFHVSARAIATHALSIFGDHQDVMACRQTGFAMLASASVQESMDLAVVAHLSTLQSSVPFVHFFDGFRTSHEANKIDVIEYEEIHSLLDQATINKFKNRALTPDNPIQRGTTQNPDIYFQNREAANSYYNNLPKIVQETMDKLQRITGRSYRLFDYYGADNATDVCVIMGSGGITMQETVKALNEQGEKVGVIIVRLYRPFSVNDFLSEIPKTCKRIAVLDRTKETGSIGEPLYLDVCAAIQESNRQITVIGGRYGLGSKEFTPTMCYAIFQNLKSKTPKNHFTVGIEDDLTNTSLDYSTPFHVNSDCLQCKFFGLGSDGTVGSNKNSVKIIGEHTNLFVQAYFCYDSKKSGGVTISHLRIGDKPIRAPYLIEQADFIACHNPSYLTRYDLLDGIKTNGTFLLNCPWTEISELEKRLPISLKYAIAQKNLKFFVIDGTKIANNIGLKGRTSTVMQAAFFYLNESIMPYKQATELLKQEIQNKFKKKGNAVVEMNYKAIDYVQNEVKEIAYPTAWVNATQGADPVPLPDDEYFNKFIQPILTLKGDSLPVSAFQADGSVPVGTTRFEKHGMAFLIPQWLEDNCIQCNQCSFACPHACIRPFLFDENIETPDVFTSRPAIGFQGKRFRIQVSPHDCMGCGVCANVCPAKTKALIMKPASEMKSTYGKTWEFAQSLPAPDYTQFKRNTLKGSQFYPPLFEFSYACAGCGETAYIKLLTQLFGERMLIANATGCSSIYGGSAPTCPYCKNSDGKGPAWANSLFEDNAEFGLGMSLAASSDKSVWIIGGDGWAYDIGFGGLDHVLASGKNVKVLVLDSEVYSNTGGQSSKSTPKGAVARFASAGKRIKKKDLGLMMMTYGYVYVASVAMGANMNQLVKAFTEAENYDGPSLIIAYSTCIAHGFDLSNSLAEQKRAVDCGYWPLYRFDPRLRENGQNPLQLDSKEPIGNFEDFRKGENRFNSLEKINPNAFLEFCKQSENECKQKRELYEKLSNL